MRCQNNWIADIALAKDVRRVEDDMVGVKIDQIHRVGKKRMVRAIIIVGSAATRRSARNRARRCEPSEKGN